MWSRLHVRWGNPPHVTSPTWGPPPSCKQALRVTQMGDGENEFVPRDQIFPLLVFYCSLFLPKISSFTLVWSIRINLDSIYLLIFYFEKLPPWIWHPFNVNMTLNLSILMTRYSNRRLDVMGARKNGAREGRGPWKCFFFFFAPQRVRKFLFSPRGSPPRSPLFLAYKGSLSYHDGDGYENVTWKVKSRCFKLYPAYSISFNSSNVGNFF